MTSREQQPMTTERREMQPVLESIRAMVETRNRMEGVLGVGRDDLAEILRQGHRAQVAEFDDWRPLAEHVLDLVALALERAGVPKP